MKKFERVVLNSATGLPVNAPTITVYHAGTVVVATIYSDEGTTTKANPFTGDSLGRYSFYAPDGDYDIKIEGTGLTTTTLSDVTVQDSKRGGYVFTDDVVNVGLANAAYNRQTAAWNRISTARPAWNLEADAVGANDYLRILHAVAAANPITWTEFWRLLNTGQWRATLAADAPALGLRVTGDTVDRLVIKNDKIEFGGGAGAIDVVLQRGAADRLDLLDALRLTGALTWATDNTVDVGASGANRPRDLFLGRHGRIGGDLDHDGSNVGFYAKAPVAQAAASANLTDSSGGTANDTVQALTNPADTPATADALRDDLVANLIPELRNNYADLAAKVNKVLTVLRDLGLMAT